jgi:thiol-disulfide isomerase/thioredoxin
MLRAKTFSQFSLVVILLTSPILSACSPQAAPVLPTSSTVATETAATPDWFNIAMTDVRTGKTFTMHDFAGKVVLIQTIAEWCPNCIFQQAESRNMVKQLGNPEDLILISLDVDSHEDEASLKQYAQDFAFEWRFAVAPLLVQRAMGNLYNAEYLNPPLDPMLLIDRQGNAHQLPYGEKKIDALQKIVEPYLAK